MFAGSEPSVVKNYLLVWGESHSAGRFLHVLAAEMKQHPPEPLRGFPRSRNAARCGQEDDARG